MSEANENNAPTDTAQTKKPQSSPSLADVEPTPASTNEPLDATATKAEPATASATSPDSDAQSQRRPRRRRSTKVEATSAKDDEPKPRSRKQRPAAPAAPAKRATPRRKKSSDAHQTPLAEPGQALMGTAPRQVYRLDPVGQTNEVPQVPVTRKAPPKAQGVNAADKITLILHPAPQSAPSHNRKRKKESQAQTAKEAMRAKAAKRSKHQKKTGPSTDVPEKNKTKLKPAWLKADENSAAEAIHAAGIEAATELVETWLDATNATALATVAALENLPGGARKAARRACNVLKARGVPIPDVKAATNLTASPEPEAIVATFVPPDAHGMSFFSISQRQAGGRFRVADIITRAPAGIVHASSGQLAGKQIRQWRNRVRERLGTPPVPVPIDWARYRVAEARKQNETSDQLLPLGLDRCAILFEPTPEVTPDHPVADLEAQVDEAAVSKATLDSEKLHRDPEFRSWLPDREAINELIAKVSERVDGDGSDNPELADATLHEEVTSATDRFFSPERRLLIAERMRDSAISVRSRAGDEQAIVVLAVAQAVREAGLITSPPSEIPFLVHFFEKSVALKSPLSSKA